MNTKTLLIEKYFKKSKHSHYQSLPKKLEKIVGKNIITNTSNHDQERLDYILEKINVKNKSLLDIGGNTGFFSFELIDKGIDRVLFYEGNKNHSDFVKLASKSLKLDNNIKIVNKYFAFKNFGKKKYDIVLLLNVLHHIGDDYGNKKIPIEKAKQNIIKQINSLVKITDILVLQIGFNWKGNVKESLFKNGTKKELIDFIKKGTNNQWEILSIGIPEIKKKIIKYIDLNSQNIKKQDKLGEFLNRPLFILKSKQHSILDKEKKFLNNLVSDYKDQTPYSEIKKRIISKITKKYTSLEKSKTALQMGCSNGYETQLLAERFLKVDVVDGSEKFINKLKQINKLKNVNFIYSLFEDYEKISNHKTYDYIFCNYVLEHVLDPVSILSSIKKLLKPQGLMFTTVPNSHAFSRQFALKMKLIKKLKNLTNNDISHGHRRIYDILSIKQNFKKAGLEIIDVKGIIFKILADFQLNRMLYDNIIEEKHIEGLQEMAEIYKQFSDSLLVISRNSKR